jgi:hypothetical protein
MIRQTDDLVEILFAQQPIECSRPAKDAHSLKEGIDRNYVHILFKTTGTEIGVQLFRSACKLDDANFENGQGNIILTGGLTLNYNKVKCIAHIDLATCEGCASLTPVTDEEYKIIMGS